MQQHRTFSLAKTWFCSFLLLQACSSTIKTSSPVSEATKVAAIETLSQTLVPATNVSVTTSTDIDWPAGTLPWDRFTLPTISPNGLYAAVQLGTPPSNQTLSGNNHAPVDSTSIELHILDPMLGRKVSPLLIGRAGLILSRATTDNEFLVECPNGSQGRWIGRISWTTGTIDWLVQDESINAFPTMSELGDLAWSSHDATEDRFHLELKTMRGQRSIDDGISDWVMPMFLGHDKLRVFKIANGMMSLVELDLRARDPLLTAITLPIVSEGATRQLAWQIASTNPVAPWQQMHSFYHPNYHRMVTWNPNNNAGVVALVPRSVAAAPVSDGTWLVATDRQVVRQEEGEDDGVHIRNNLAIPIATTSKQWTHLMLIPDGNRLEVRAINLSN